MIVLVDVFSQLTNQYIFSMLTEQWRWNVSISKNKIRAMTDWAYSPRVWVRIVCSIGRKRASLRTTYTIREETCRCIRYLVYVWTLLRNPYSYWQNQTGSREHACFGYNEMCNHTKIWIGAHNIPTHRKYA